MEISKLEKIPLHIFFLQFCTCILLLLFQEFCTLKKKGHLISFCNISFLIKKFFECVLCAN